MLDFRAIHFTRWASFLAYVQRSGHVSSSPASALHARNHTIPARLSLANIVPVKHIAIITDYSFSTAQDTSVHNLDNMSQSGNAENGHAKEKDCLEPTPVGFWSDTLLNNLQTVPQALSPAVGLSAIDLRPFLPPVATPTVSVALIGESQWKVSKYQDLDSGVIIPADLVITSFFATTFYMPVHRLFLNTSAGHPPLKKSQWMLYRYISSISAYFLLYLA